MRTCKLCQAFTRLGPILCHLLLPIELRLLVSSFLRRRSSPSSLDHEHKQARCWVKPSSSLLPVQVMDVQVEQTPAHLYFRFLSSHFIYFYCV